MLMHRRQRIMKPSLEGTLKSSRTEISEMGGKNKRRLKKYLQAKGNTWFHRSTPNLTLKEGVVEDERSAEKLVIRTLVIVEPTPEPGKDLNGEMMEASADNDKQSMTPPVKRKRGILNRMVSRMMASSSSSSNGKARGTPPPPSPEEHDKEEASESGTTSLRNNSPVMDRKRSDGTVDTSKNSLEKGELVSLEEDDDATAMILFHHHRRHCYHRDNQSHAGTVDASTVVVSNRSNPVTRILCNMSEEATIREINAWRNAACDLLLL